MGVHGEDLSPVLEKALDFWPPLKQDHDDFQSQNEGILH